MMLEKIMKSEHDVREDEESGHDIGEDREILARCRRTRNKTKGSNSGTMPKNPKQNEGIESEPDAGEPETKRDRIRARCRRN